MNLGSNQAVIIENHELDKRPRGTDQFSRVKGNITVNVNDSLDYVEVVARFYNSEGQNLYTSVDTFEDLESNESKEFEIMYSDRVSPLEE